MLHYAIADVGWFVRDGDPLDAEAWRRGETIFLPGWRAGLYPPALSEGARQACFPLDTGSKSYYSSVSPGGG